MPEPSPLNDLRATSRTTGRPALSRATYFIDEWMRQAAKQIADQAGPGVSEADVVRQCLGYGLRELYGKESPTPTHNGL